MTSNPPGGNVLFSTLDHPEVLMRAMLSLVLLLAAADPPMRPGTGDVAPDFSLSATNGKTVKLADYRGKKTVVLAFFPKAFTGG